jgi:hypothetical protein
MRPIEEYRHWTKRGTFFLRFDFVLGIAGWKLFVGDRYLGFFTYPGIATRDLASGELDKDLGFSARDLAIPADVKRWNQFS